ncbi:basement membrane-specific heparan sulfate proteoglycan core protein isoform X13 [Pseudoliparis swirei]|uniref:basement membrane-specific heparan sulfate proteoglycan core protein isoform X13 n=1 Tax=Pseudoliparis swirei TaxID=2059687 RepID=UPI0024BDBCAD|nr:basement membrane-specific heparan sulfate proteoglycan core protein isoform X13 [Pseudoliparis swirei]
MGTPTTSICGLILSLILTCQLVTVSQASKVWGEVPLPEDLEAEKAVQASQSLLDDDEDFAADEASGELPSGEDDGSTPWSSVPVVTIYYRALVNFTDSLVYGPELDDIFSSAYNEISEAVVDTLESDYNRIPGVQTVNVVLIKKMIREDGVDIFVEMDVGSDYNSNEEQIRSVLYNVVKEGSIASYVTSVQGFQFRRLGEVQPLPPVEPIAVPVNAVIRPCMSDEHRCGDGTCILAEYLCDNRPDCRDLSDETNCESKRPTPAASTTPATITTTVKKPPRPPSPPGPCRADQATCQSGECIPRDYVCDGERDCSDGSDEFRCGTPSPCEPNEFKCRNGRCALKLWRCDGDNDCEDNSDETDCPTKSPGDRCAPEQFECLGDRTCIPASYQCDDEPDCPDRSDEYDCTPPSVTSPPEESIQAARGATVTFKCQAVGVPTPIITWRLNWGHIPVSGRISMTSENGHGTLTIRDVKEADQGAYTCEAINAKGLVFGIPDGVLTLTSNPNSGKCPDGHFSVENRCVSCFCAGISKNCKSTGRYRNHISLRFTQEEDFQGVNVTYPSRPGIPPLSSTQLLINPEMEEFQLVDLSRRFLNLDSFWTLPRRFLGNKIDSYGGSLKFKVRYTLARGLSEPVEKPDVMLVGNGRRLVYRRGNPTPARVVNQREIKFTEDNWHHSNGRTVSREELMMTLANLDSLSVRTIFDNHMVSVALSDIVMDTTTVEFSILGHAKDVEECRCPPGYSGLSCETCSPGFERVPGGSYLGTCAGCNCNGHASACDPINGHCLSCQHNTEGPQCDKCRHGYFGDPSRGRPDDCKPCPCPYYETSRRFSDTCFVDVDQQPTCDACRPGYTGRRCEKCAPGYQGNPLLPNGRCTPTTPSQSCDNRGTISSRSGPCSCKNNVAGTVCDECKTGFFHLSETNPEGCLRCFCMGVTKQCASSTWNRDQVRGGVNGQRFSLSNSANTKTISEGISQRGSSEVVYRSFSGVPNDIYYWVLPESFRGDKVTAYGGELRYTVRFEPFQRSLVIDGQPDVVLQGNGIFLEHHSQTKPLPRVPQTVTVIFRESGWRRSDGQPCTREHLLMALADVTVFMIRATYADNMAESSISNIKMDVAVPHSTGHDRALEVEECACPQGYRGPSCQECDEGYTRTSSGLYLGTCERCNCNGHASGCDTETGRCLQCLHNTAGPRCERCQTGFYGNPVTDGAQACQPCPCPGTASNNQFSPTCHLESDGKPTCDNCAPGYSGRRCERCAAGYTGNPLLGQGCSVGNNEVNGHCYNCDQKGSDGCNGGACRCKLNVEGPSCSSCKSGTFHLSQEDKDGCLSCFCMGVTQQCSSSTYYRDLVSLVFSPGNFQGFALVNRQRTNRISTGFTVEVYSDVTQLSYTNFDYLGQEPHYWQFPEVYQGDKVGSYGGKIKYSISYVAGPRGTLLDDGDVQIIGNDITLVARQPWQRRQLGSREINQFEIVFKEENWRRPDGMPATREHLMMVLADLDDILIRASYSTEMRSSSIFDISMEVSVPNYSGLAQAVEVEQCRCPPGYKGLSCQDCAPGYTRTGGGLYLGHCELCECNGHSDSCHPETGICASCLHNTQGELCEQCASGFFGDPTVGTPEDCQPCACPHNDPDNQFSPTCESLGNGGYQCTACQPGYTGQYCERCAPGYVGNPQERRKCRPYDAAASLVVKVYPEKVQSSHGGSVTLRCQVSGSPPHYFYWSREDGRSISSTADRRRQGAELYFPNVQPRDAGVYICTCRDQRSTNRSRAEIVVTSVPSKAIEVTIEEPKAQTVRVGSTINFICTAKSKSPAYTLVWTRMGNGKLPNRAMDFNGILTIQNVQSEDAGAYVCTGSNMFAMDEGNAILYVPEASQTQMFYTAYEMFEGHGKQEAQPVATVTPSVLTVQQGRRAEFRCTVSGNPTAAIEWIGGPGNRMSPRAVVRGGVLTFTAVDPADEGEYTCKALNTHGEHTARASLFVQKSNPTGLGTQPQVQVSPQNIEAHEGDNLRLYCRATGVPTPKLTWLKNGGQIPPQAIPSLGFHQFKSNSLDVLQRRIEELQARIDRTDIGTLLIPNIQMSDSGTYMCVGSNSIGSNSAPIKVSVLKGDHSLSVVSIQPAIADVQEGQNLELNCFARGNPPPQVLWTKASGRLSSNHQVLGSQLRILSATPEDSGEYICRVKGNSGNPGSHVQQASVSVSVTSSSSRLQSPIIAIEPHSSAVRVGESASFRCRVYSGAQPVRLQWKLANNQPLPDNVKVGPDGSVITITNARPMDHGAYRCVASNPFGITHTIVSLIVKVSPVATVTPVGPIHVRVGEPINLECQASGEPRPSVSWHRLDSNRKTMLSSPVPMESNAVMQILVARPEDRGTYVCTARNNEGTTDTKVEVIVEGGSQVPTVPRASVPEPLMVVVEGQIATLRCEAHGLPPPTITWSKLRSPLPWRHNLENNSLVLPTVGRQDSGEYICSATNNMGTSEVTIMLDVETPPYATSVPDDVAVRVGEVIRLQCLAHGTPPLTYTWTKLDGNLPPRAQVSGGDLQINLATAEDAGSYKCVVSNKVANSEVIAKVTVRSPLAVRVSPQVEVKAQGSAVEFTCSSAGGIETKIEWLKEGGALPPNHHVKDGVLRIENLEQSNEGVYICRANSVYGQAQDMARLTIQALPKVMINVRTSVQTVMIGNSVEFECQAVGDPEPTVKWSKVGGSLPAHIMVKDGMLRIERVTEADAGQYRCTATNDVGSVQSHVVLNVQSIPQIAALPETKEVTVGSDAVLPCVASGYPSPEIKWSKLEEELPPKCFQELNALTVPRVSHEDSGIYVCTASNKQGRVEAFTTLQVHERVIPYFAQEPLSYLTLPTIKHAYKAFSIKINFRPDNVDGLILYAGMILYNGQRRTTGADFISLGLVGGRLEFRFDVGSGMASIRDTNPVKLGEFHTVELYRNHTLGYIIVDGGEPINGSSQGKFQGLDLNEELHVGGYPNYTVLAKTAGIKTGFVGCIRQLVIQGEEVIFKDLDHSSTGVTNCPTCKDHPCQNGGRCEDSEASLYKCGCPRGFTGSNCQHHSSLHCHSEACGPDATCINRQNGLGYDCRCHLGKSGNKCMDGELVTTPLFDGEESYIAYPPLTNVHDDLRVELEFKPLERDGLMFFCGGKKIQVEDFVAISMVEGHVEFRYELGTGQAILLSPEPVTLGQWHRVVVEQNKKAGHLKVDQGPVVKKTSPGKSQGLNIHTPMYLGGVPNMDILPKPANVSELFEGCIGEVSINNKKVDLSYSFTESRSIRQCVDNSPCDHRPCLNGGHCMSNVEYEYQCLCEDGFEGERCEVVKDACQSNLQCQNGGSCVNGQCVCAAGHTGLNCGETIYPAHTGQVSSFPEALRNLESSEANDSPYQYAAHFSDDGYIALPKSVFPRSGQHSPETIELEINTGSSEGLILWQGVETNGARNLRKVHASKKELGEHGKGKDFISLGLQNGHLVFSYQLGSGEAKILSRRTINDGRWHKVTAVRTGKDGYIQIDGGTALYGQSKGRSIMVNTKGSVYLGGAPDMAAMTGGKFLSGMTGCVRNLAMMNARPGQQLAQAIDLQTHGAHGMNVLPCSK